MSGLFRTVSRLLTLLLLVGFSDAPGALAAAPGKDGQKCINTLAKEGQKVSKVAAKEFEKCILEVGKQRASDPLVCAELDAKGKLVKSWQKLADNAAKSCAVETPDFAVASPPSLSLAATLLPRSLSLDLLGSPSGDAITGLNEAKCQKLVVATANKIAGRMVQGFAGCLKSELKDETLTSGADLESACAAEVAADSRGRVLKEVAKLIKFLDKKCSTFDLDTVFPGECAGASNFPICVKEAAACRTCRYLNVAHGLEIDCDLFDDETANESCPLCGNNVVDSGEACDDGDEISNGEGSCTEDCSAVQVCGDGVITGTEECESVDLVGQSCETRGFLFGALSCTASCGFDESGCGDVGPTLPDPSTLAPDPGGGANNDLLSMNSYLYESDTPIQIGADSSVFERERAALVTGLVTDTSGNPLPGVYVGVKDRPSYGYTFSRSDGRYDLVVNGGGQLQIRFRMGGYLEVHRRAEVSWQSATDVDPVAMTPVSDVSTTVVLDEITSVQAAVGDVEIDARGTRQGIVLFEPGVSASMTLPDGSEVALDSMTVRITEYTVGSEGLAAMPAPLPPYTDYTYAVEVSVDEAQAVGAVSVNFDQPVPFYVDNFLGFPTGTGVPYGYYDRDLAQWVAYPDGIVLDVVSVTAGVADIDADGDGLADSAVDLEALGISTDERTKLAELYPSGASLWRITADHFTPFDLNWAWMTLFGIPNPFAEPWNLGWLLGNSCPDTAAGSIIDVENQTVAELVGITGSPHALVYNSAHVPGNTQRFTWTIPLTGDDPPAEAESVRLMVDFTGIGSDSPEAAQDFEIVENLSVDFEWNGEDVWGRWRGLLQVEFLARFSFGASTIYYGTPSGCGTSFGSVGCFEPSAVPAPGPAGSSSGEPTLGPPVSLFSGWIGSKTPEWQGLGGWTFADVHFYHAPSKALYLGTGKRRQIDGQTMNRVTGACGHVGLGEPCLRLDFDEGDPAVNWRLGNERTPIAAGADGTVYFGGSLGWAAGRQYGLLASDPDGKLRRVAVGGTAGMGTGWPASIPVLGDYTFDRPDGTTGDVSGRVHDLAIGPDGSIYALIGPGIFEGLPAGMNGRTVWRIFPDGSVEHVAGTLTLDECGTGSLNYFRFCGGFSGDGGPAINAEFQIPLGIGVSSDGDLLIADTYNHRVRRVGPDGIINTIAGNGQACGVNSWVDLTFHDKGLCSFLLNSGPAREKRLIVPSDVATAPDGRIFVSSVNNAIFVIGRDGIMDRYAGNGFRPSDSATFDSPDGSGDIISIEPLGDASADDGAGGTQGAALPSLEPGVGSGWPALLRQWQQPDSPGR